MKNINDKLFFLLTILFLLFVLSGCKNNVHNSPPPLTEDDSNVEKETTSLSNSTFLPINIQSGYFNTICGWLDDMRLLYITDHENGSEVYIYNLQNGDSELFFKSEAPIVSVLLSPSKEKVLIHSSYTTNEATLSVLDNSGQEIVTKKIPSAEVSLEWNPFDENRILVSSFSEDWEFNVFQLNIKQGTLQEILVPQPFGSWVDSNKLLYLDWDEETPTLTTDLRGFNLATSNSEYYFSNIYHLDSLGNNFFTISVEEENKENATYSFYSNEMEKTGDFNIPHLSQYSGWFIPYYDYNVEKATFLTNQPVSSTDVDLYSEGFQLVSHNIETGEETVILQGLENEPISCSPSGEVCLMGFYYEKLLNLNTKEVTPLVEEKYLQ